MAQDTEIWPLPKFNFQVEWDGRVMSFQEVSGLSVEAQPIEYRHGDSAVFSVVKMPGLRKYGNVTLKRGVFKSGPGFWDWFNAIKMNTAPRKTVKITLLDEKGGATMVWTLADAFPTKVVGVDLKASGNDVAVDTIELSHDGLTIANG